MQTKYTILLFLVLLAVSSCLASYTQAATANEPVEVPFNFYRNSILVQAKINGKGPFNMLIDTGIDPSLMDLKTAKAIGLKVASVGEQGTGGGTDINLAYETQLPRLQLGNLTASKIKAVAIDLSKPSKALGKTIQGVLGYSLLTNRIVQIDYPHRIVRFYASSPFPITAHPSNTADRTNLFFRYRNDILVQGVLVNGKRMTANLDTGSNGSFQITPAAVIRLNLQTELRKAQISKSAGLNGILQNREGKVHDITIGGISVHGPAVVFYGKGMGYDKEAWGIRIGNAFLKDYVVTLDYQHNIITLERH